MHDPCFNTSESHKTLSKNTECQLNTRFYLDTRSGQWRDPSKDCVILFINLSKSLANGYCYRKQVSEVPSVKVWERLHRALGITD